MPQFTITLSGSDGVASANTTFLINVTGTPWGEFSIKIITSSISALATLLTLYELRALFLNRCCKQRYEKDSKEYAVGANFALKLVTPPDRIVDVTVRLPIPKTKCCHFFKLPRTLPGGAAMPRWLDYDPFTNILRTVEPIPAEMAGKVLVVQVAGDMGVILEQFDLRIESSRQDADISDDAPFSPSGLTVTSEPGEIKDQVRGGFEKNKKPGDLEMQSWNPSQNSGTRQKQSDEEVVTVHRESKINPQGVGIVHPGTESVPLRRPAPPSPWPLPQSKPGKPPVASDSPLVQAGKRNVPNPPVGSVKVIQSSKSL